MFITPRSGVHENRLPSPTMMNLAREIINECSNVLDL